MAMSYLKYQILLFMAVAILLTALSRATESVSIYLFPIIAAFIIAWVFRYGRHYFVRFVFYLQKRPHFDFSDILEKWEIAANEVDDTKFVYNLQATLDKYFEAKNTKVFPIVNDDYVRFSLLKKINALEWQSNPILDLNALNGDDYFRELVEANNHEFPFFIPVAQPDYIGAVILLNKKAGLWLKTREFRNFILAITRLYAVLMRDKDTSRKNQLTSVQLEQLMQLAMDLSATLDIDDLLKRILYRLRETVPFAAGGIFLIDKDHNYIYGRQTLGYDIKKATDIRVKFNQGILGQVMQSGHSFILDDVDTNSSYYKLRPQTRSQITVPIIYGGDILGLFNLESDMLHGFGKSEKEFLDAYAGVAALSLRNARLYRDSEIKQFLEGEMLNAGKVQSALLPSNFSTPANYDIYARNIPSLQVGGDIYDVVNVENDLYISIGDVSGKGASGAILMAVLFAGFRSYLHTKAEVCEIIAKLNHLMFESTIPGKFATFFLSRLLPRENMFTYSNAGHNSPLLIKANRNAIMLEEGGLLLGFKDDESYEQKTIAIEAGDTIILYTDGLSESMNADQQEYDQQHLVDFASSNLHLSAFDLTMAILEDARKFTGKTSFDDDLTIIVIKCKF
jgi:sigma-B regulation protein RsbU (phosphoserine phosphatase)